MQPTFNLTLWQKKQATLLYHFASLDYLKGLQQRVNELVHFGDQTADLAIKENRDATLVSKRWGNRDTVDNWVNNAWTFLKEYQQSVARDIADRVTETYDVTGNHSCMGGLQQFSTLWATVEEEEKFESMCAAVSDYAGNIDLVPKTADVEKLGTYVEEQKTLAAANLSVAANQTGKAVRYGNQN